MTTHGGKVTRRLRVKKKHAYAIQKEWNAGDYALLHVVTVSKTALFQPKNISSSFVKKPVKLKNDGKQWRDKRLPNNNQTPARARDELKLLSYFQSRVFFFLNWPLFWLCSSSTSESVLVHCADGKSVQRCPETTKVPQDRSDDQVNSMHWKRSTTHTGLHHLSMWWKVSSKTKWHVVPEEWRFDWSWWYMSGT